MSRIQELSDFLKKNEPKIIEDLFSKEIKIHEKILGPKIYFCLIDLEIRFFKKPPMRNDLEEITIIDELVSGYYGLAKEEIKKRSENGVHLSSNHLYCLNYLGASKYEETSYDESMKFLLNYAMVFDFGNFFYGEIDESEGRSFSKITNLPFKKPLFVGNLGGNFDSKKILEKREIIENSISRGTFPSLIIEIPEEKKTSKLKIERYELKSSRPNDAYYLSLMSVANFIVSSSLEFQSISNSLEERYIETINDIFFHYTKKDNYRLSGIQIDIPNSLTEIGYGMSIDPKLVNDSIILEKLSNRNFLNLYLTMMSGFRKKKKTMGRIYDEKDVQTFNKVVEKIHSSIAREE